MIAILDDQGAREVDEALLVKSEGLFEDDNERTTWVEYRWPGSDVIVHRSVHVTMKHWPHAAGAVAATLG